MGIRLESSKRQNGSSAKGQVAMEFVLLIVFSFMILIVFSIVAREQIIDIGLEEERSIMKDISGMVQTEINTAMGVSDDYRRVFYVPEEISEGHDYSIGISNNYIIANTTDFEVVLRISSINGNIQKGNNTITKRGGLVYLNQ